MTIVPDPHLGKVSQALWNEIQTRKPDAPTEVLALQACRIVDRLDRLDVIIRTKKSWFELAEEADENGCVAVVVDAALGEYRQQALALSTILNKLGVGKLEELPITKAGNKSDELRKRRSARLAGLPKAKTP